MVLRHCRIIFEKDKQALPYMPQFVIMEYNLTLVQGYIQFA